MVVKVYYAEISGNKEVKKHQQRVMMILDSKQIPYEAVDITEAGKESAKEFMMKNAKPKGDAKIVLSPQVFNDEVYCGDYDDFDLANENDILEDFLHAERVIGHTLNGGTNGTELPKTAAEPQGKPDDSVADAAEPAKNAEESATDAEHPALDNQDVAQSPETDSNLAEPSTDSSIPADAQTKASNVPKNETEEAED